MEVAKSKDDLGLFTYKQRKSVLNSNNVIKRGSDHAYACISISCAEKIKSNAARMVVRKFRPAVKYTVKINIPVFTANKMAFKMRAAWRGFFSTIPVAASNIEKKGGKWLIGRLLLKNPIPDKIFFAPPKYMIESKLTPAPKGVIHNINSKAAIPKTTVKRIINRFSLFLRFFPSNIFGFINTNILLNFSITDPGLLPFFTISGILDCSLDIGIITGTRIRS
jgi:hypothetical protein